MIFTHSARMASSVVVRCGLIDTNFTPASRIASQREYIWWSATVYSMRLFFHGSQPTSTNTSVWSRITSHEVCGEYTSMSPMM